METADEVMLRNARSGKDITPPWMPQPRPFSPEELAAFGPAPRFTLPDPRPYVQVKETKKGKYAIEAGLKGTF